MKDDERANHACVHAHAMKIPHVWDNLLTDDRSRQIASRGKPLDVSFIDCELIVEPIASKMAFHFFVRPRGTIVSPANFVRVSRVSHARARISCDNLSHVI